MKKSTSLFLIMLFSAAAAFAQHSNTTKKSEGGLVILVNTAKWCPACQANGERVKSEVISSYMKRENCSVVVNDLSDDNTKAASAEACKKAGISSIAESNKGTGMIYLINKSTGKIAAKVSVSEPSAKIKSVIEETLTKI